MLLGRFAQRLARHRNAALLPVAVFLFVATFVIVPHAVSAATQSTLGLEFASASGLSTTDIRTIVGNVIRAFFALLGVIAVGLIIYAGFLYMTAAGNEEKVTQAKRILINATIGLIIILSAYAITEFILRAVNGEGGLGGGGGSSPESPQFFIASGSGALGSGVLDYHYPEAGQTGVPRNTRIAITFKKPLVLSTIIKGLPAQTGPGPVDVKAEGPLNTDNIKIVLNEELQPGTGNDADARFNARYSKALSSGLTATATVVSDPTSGTQTVVIKLGEPIGSPTNDKNYRVALRGGDIRTGSPDLGIQVWETNATGTGYKKTLAFTKMDADGGYFWSFTTNTTIDTTPPKIEAVVPVAKTNPVATCDADKESCVYRNQLLQIYFDEAVDPTSASGTIGPGGGFNNIDIKAKCRSHDLPCDFGRVCSNDATKSCTGNDVCGAGNTCLPTPAASYDSFTSVAGTLSIGNKYRTVEFLPKAPCEGVTQNSCGEPVYCLPKNVQLSIVARAATVGTDPPQASEDNGVVDMVGNSMDGNGNASAEGPVTATRTAEYTLNPPRPAITASMSDTAAWLYAVGENIDLVPPKVTAVDPPSTAPGESPGPDTAYKDGGSSKVPVEQPIKVTWSKIMSVTSMRGGVVEDPTATVVMDIKECAKVTCASPSTCTCTDNKQIQYVVRSVLKPTPGDPRFTEMVIDHRPFFTANDLGYSEAEANPIGGFSGAIPKYVPTLRAKLKDDKQNCFYPSVFQACVGMDGTKKSCCNKTAQGTYSCPAQ